MKIAKTAFPLISPQSTEIYRLLIKNHPLTAKELGKHLHILPNAVYRSLKPLIALDLVQEIKNYPLQFTMNPSQNAIDFYLFSIKHNFLKTFFPEGVVQNTNDAFPDLLEISFIQNRKELLNCVNNDMKVVKKNVCHIISGLEHPAENILEIKRAVERKVKIKFLVQQLDEVNKSMLHNWQKIGIEVKYFSLLETRIIIFDSQIVYMTSYNPQKKEEAIGVRFDYPPIAEIMKEVFQQRWKLGKKI